MVDSLEGFQVNVNRMTKHKRKRHLWLISLIIYVVGCSALSGESLPSRLTPQPTLELTPIHPTLPLSPKNGARARELVTLSGELSEPVAALAFTPDARELLTVHGTDGLLQRWWLEDGTLMQTLDIGPVGLAAVAFDAQAELVATGAGLIEPAIQAGYAVDISGARVWDTQSGDLILDTSENDRRRATDVVLSPDGHWLAEVYQAGITFSEIDTGASPYGFAMEVFESPRKPQPSITAAALDPVGTWVAYADDIGWVRIEEWNSGVPGHHQNATIEHGGREESPTPLALAIDPSRHRMAMVTTEFLIVWNLQAQFNKMLIQESLPSSPLASLVFSPDGSLLSVGTASGWQIWSIENKKLLLENEHPTFAVAFSPDGRIFAWGDTEGDIHLWGVPTP
jgi:WD40 repeat protein